MRPEAQEKPEDRNAPKAVREELHLLEKVRSVLVEQGNQQFTDPYDGELIRLRDALVDERLDDDRAMLLEQMDRLQAVAEARARFFPRRIDPQNPYFAHLQYQTDSGEKRDILLGKNTFVRAGIRIVDWRQAPISRVFYRYREGDEFSESIAGKTLCGRVIVRRTVTIVAGRLVRVGSADNAYICTPAGWQEVSGQASRLHGGAGAASRPGTTAGALGLAGGERTHREDKHLPEIAALLDAEQFDLLTRDGSELLVVAGGAGSGKTTVGLHRLAYLTFHDARRFRPGRMQVLVFGKALARYISRVLPALGVKGVGVQTLPAWSQQTARRHFPKLPAHVLESTPASVVRFKTHRILVPMLEEAARKAKGSDPVEVFDDLFTDRFWMRDGVARYAPGAFSDAELAEVHRWCTDQQFRRAEGRTANDDEAPGYDEEDFMVLLRLYQLLIGRLRWGKGRGLSYDHLMVDEAQDFSPLELLVLMETVRDGSLTLAGDPAQKITTNDFSDWSEVLRLIHREHVQVEPLQVSYRSTRAIMELALAVLGPLAPAEPLQAVRDGAPVDLFRFPGMGGAMTFLQDALQDLTMREPHASVAVLTRDAEGADLAYAALARGVLPHLRRVVDQEFAFEPGIEVTDVAQTKGLEFDYVVLLGVDRLSYPDTPVARHLLHVGMTRAIHQLWLLSWEPTSSLLPSWLQPHLAG